MLATHGFRNFLLPSSEVVIMGLSCSSALNVEKYRRWTAYSFLPDSWGNVIEAKINLVNILQVLNKM